MPRAFQRTYNGVEDKLSKLYGITVIDMGGTLTMMDSSRMYSLNSMYTEKGV